MQDAENVAGPDAAEERAEPGQQPAAAEPVPAEEATRPVGPSAEAAQEEAEREPEPEPDAPAAEPSATPEAPSEPGPEREQPAGPAPTAATSSSSTPTAGEAPGEAAGDEARSDGADGDGDGDHGQADGDGDADGDADADADEPSFSDPEDFVDDVSEEGERGVSVAPGPRAPRWGTVPGVSPLLRVRAPASGGRGDPGKRIFLFLCDHPPYSRCWHHVPSGGWVGGCMDGAHLRGAGTCRVDTSV